MKPNPKAANGFKIILSFTIILLIAFILLGFYYKQNSLKEFAQSIPKNNQSTAQSLENPNLNLSRDEINKIDSVYFQKTDYQSLVKKALDGFGRKSNVRISEYVFTNINDKSDLSGLQTSVVELKVEESVEYNNFLRLLKYVENSLPKMQVVNCNLEKESNSSKIVVKEFKIEVYL